MGADAHESTLAALLPEVVGAANVAARPGLDRALRADLVFVRTRA
jgi:hypothetical protein